MIWKTKPKSSRTTGRNALWVIAGLLAASGLIRIGGGPGQAIAREIAALTTTPQETAEPLECRTDEETSAILLSLLTREATMNERERLLEEKARSIVFAEAEIRQNLEILVKAEEELSATMSTASAASEEDLARLTSVYENMKPKDASLLFEEMAVEFAAGFVGRMRPDAAAQIMTGLSPEKAYSISVILAGRNARTPTE